MDQRLNKVNVDFLPYEKDSMEIAVPRGISKEGEGYLKSGTKYGSLVNKLHLIKLANGIPASDEGIAKHDRYKVQTFTDLCRMQGTDALEYDAEDFLYCKKLDFPINRLITLRRFASPCTDNIFDKHNQYTPDIARMVTYFDQDTNNLEELLAFSYGLNWKELTAEMEQASAIGDQSGFSGFSKKVMSFIDPTMAKNNLMGDNLLNYDPKHDQNKTYGPIDSITKTHIRDVGLNFEKEFDVVFEYELRSWNGRTPEFAMRDVLANVLATTYNNAKFWSGSRYWVGERPSRYNQAAQFMNPTSIEQFVSGATKALKAAIGGFASKEKAIDTLTNIIKNGAMIALGKMLDSVGRPSILVMNSLLSGEPTGNWHLTIGNPDNPIMCIGNLLLTDVDVKFPTDSLSYGDFPTKMTVNVKLKPGQPKDKAGIETMFNMGKQRIYYNPTKVKRTTNKTHVNRRVRTFFGYENLHNAIKTTLEDVHDFTSKVVEHIVDNGGGTKATLASNEPPLNTDLQNQIYEIESGNSNIVNQNGTRMA